MAKAKKTAEVAANAEAANTVTMMEVLNLNPSQVVVPTEGGKLGRYAGHDGEALKRLAVSIHTDGQLSPIQVTRDGQAPDTYHTVFGNGRTRAVALLREGFEFGGKEYKDETATVKAEVVTGTPKALFLRNASENAARSELSIMDRVTVFTSAKAFGVSGNDLARTYGIDKGLVSKYCKLSNLPKSIQDKIHAGYLGLSHGTVLEASGLTEEQMLEVVGSDVAPSVSALNDAIEKVLNPEKPAPEGETPAATTTDESAEPAKRKGSTRRPVAELIPILREQLHSGPVKSTNADGVETVESGPNDDQCTALHKVCGAILAFIDRTPKMDEQKLRRVLAKVSREIREWSGEQSREEKENDEPAGSAKMPK